MATSSPRSALSTEFLLYLALFALILFRTLPFVLYGKELLDSDEALFGLMAKHLAEGRDPALFLYGHRYPPGIVSWCAAPLFWMVGPSVGLLRLPLLLINLLVGGLLAFLIRRESKLSAMNTFLCCLWFALPSMTTARGFTNAADGAIEPFFFVLLTWILRNRPVTGGLLCGIGCAGRPFAIFGIPAVVLLRFREKGLKSALLYGAQWCLGVVATYSALHAIAARFSVFYYGWATPLYWKRFIFMLEDIRGFFAEIVPRTIGLKVQEFNRPVTLPVNDHFNYLGFALCGIGVFLLFTLLRSAWRDRNDLWEKMAEKDLQFGFFLTLVGLVNFGAFVILSPPTDDLRYTYDLILGVIGIYVLWIQIAGKPGFVKGMAFLFLLGCMANNLFANGRNSLDLIRLDRDHPTENLIQYLRQNGIQAGIGDYWVTHTITFDTNEAIVIADGLNGGGSYPPSGKIYLSTPPEHRAEIRLHAFPGAQPVETWFVKKGPPDLLVQ